MSDIDYRPIEINGQKYLPVDELVTSSRSKNEVLSDRLDSVGGFIQQLKQKGWGYIIVVCLIPEGKIAEYQAYEPKAKKKSATEGSFTVHGLVDKFFNGG